MLLARELWDDRDQMDYFAAWTWTEVYCTRAEEISPAAICKDSLFSSEDWWRTFKRKGGSFLHDPFYGGTNPLHLGHSQSFGYDVTEGGKPVLYYDVMKRQAVIIAAQFSSWRCDLDRLGAELPLFSSHSWHVEVYDHQVGFLGKFRQSRKTGLWFAGKHSLHMRGN